VKEFWDFLKTGNPTLDKESIDNCCCTNLIVTQDRYRLVSINDTVPRNRRLGDPHRIHKLDTVEAAKRYIQENKFVPPQLYEKNSETDKHPINDGNHRICACRDLGYKKIICSIPVQFEASLSDVCKNVLDGVCSCECRAGEIARKLQVDGSSSFSADGNDVVISFLKIGTNRRLVINLPGMLGTFSSFWFKLSILDDATLETLKTTKSQDFIGDDQGLTTALQSAILSFLNANTTLWG
jgi:hypothetical protein